MPIPGTRPVTLVFDLSTTLDHDDKSFEKAVHLSGGSTATGHPFQKVEDMIQGAQ